MTRKSVKLKKIYIDHDHSNNYITAQSFNKLTSEIFVARLAQANLASKNNIADFLEKTDFDNKQKKLNKKVTWNKTRHVNAEKKIADLTNKVVQIWKKDMIF